MSISTVKLYYRRSGATYSCNLYTDPADFGGAPYIAVRKTVSLYAPLVPETDGRATHLRVRRSGATYAVGSIYTDIPTNMIVLYKDALDVPSGGSYFTASGDNYIIGGSAVGTTGGAATHTGADHGGSDTANSGSVANEARDDRTGLKYVAYTNSSSHTHTIAHTHTGDVNNDPPFNKYIGVYGAPCINTNALFLSDIDFTLLSANWSFYDQVNRFIKLGNSATLGGGSLTSGGHAQAIASTSTYSCSSFLGWEEYSTVPPQAHDHKMWHTHPDITYGVGSDDAPLYSRLSGYVWSGSAFYTKAEIPIGSIAFFTSTTLPAGWSRVSVMDGRLVRGYDVKTTGYDHNGSSTHNHYYTGTCANNAGTSGEGWGGSGSGDYKPGFSGHTIDHGHSAVSWMPPWYTMVIGRRDS